KDFRSFLHVSGFSSQKQGDVLLAAWRANPDFPPLTYIASTTFWVPIPAELRSAHHVEVIVRELSETDLRHHQQTHGIHVYPSYAEGFGHALNEARICGS